MRVIGLDVHRRFAQVAELENGVVRQGGRIDLAVAAKEIVPPVPRREDVATTLTPRPPENRMDIHENARTTPHSRLLMVQRLDDGWSIGSVAAACGVCAKTVRKWRDRYCIEGESGLRDRSCRPHASPTRLSEERVVEIEELRRRRLSGPAIARHWAALSPRSV